MSEQVSRIFWDSYAFLLAETGDCPPRAVGAPGYSRVSCVVCCAAAFQFSGVTAKAKDPFAQLLSSFATQPCGSIDRIASKEGGLPQTGGLSTLPHAWPICRLDDLILPRKFLRMCRRRMRRPKVADSTGVELTGAGLLMRTLILRRLLRREVLAADEQNVGLLLPPSVAGLVANAALAHRPPRRRQSELHHDLGGDRTIASPSAASATC